MGWTSPKARELFQRLVNQEAERRSRDQKAVSEALQTVPASQATLDALGALPPVEAECALRTHPGYTAHRKIESLRTMLALFRRAIADLAEVISEFPELGRPDDRFSREELENNISTRVNKELFAALCAAKTLVDYSRRIRDFVDPDLFDSKLKTAFHSGEHALITGLRNSVLHQVHSRANWQIRWRAGTRTTHFVIQREDLLTEGELSSAAREHLDGLGATCDITELLQGYSERVDQFYAWLLPEVESHLPLEVSDYRACRRAVKRQHGRLSYKALIGLWGQAGVDPYQHLPKHLTSGQLKEIESFPHRSPQQVDYIISCLDEDGICDDQLRAIVYEFFGVPSFSKEAVGQTEETVRG